MGVLEFKNQKHNISQNIHVTQLAVNKLRKRFIGVCEFGVVKKSKRDYIKWNSQKLYSGVYSTGEHMENNRKNT